MAWLPRSLLGRNALLIVALIALGQIGGALVFRQMVLRPRLEQIADSVARNVGGIRAGLLALPPSERAGFMERFNQRVLTDAAPGTAAGSGLRVALTPLERSFVRSVSARVAQQGAEAMWRREPDGSLALHLTLDGSEHWMVMPGVLPAREFTGAWVAVSAASALLALGGGLWFQRRLNQPLARVVQAAHTLAQGRQPLVLPESGPTEVATLGRSFNQLVGSLQRTERERALMLAGVSHDLRTPLTKLRLAVEILHGKGEPELLASMERSVEEMDDIVGQFLDFARGDEAEIATPGDLDALAGDVAASFADHGKALQWERTPVPLMPMRPQAMRRAMVNLVENAWRHGRQPVQLSTGSDARTVWFEVADHGDGIPAAQVDALKQPFRRAEGARSGAAGAGLGLAIVERVTQMHDGRFDLLAAEHGGLRARVALPRS